MRITCRQGLQSGLVPGCDTISEPERIVAVEAAIEAKWDEIYDRDFTEPTEEEWSWFGRAYHDLGRIVASYHRLDKS